MNNQYTAEKRHWWTPLLNFLVHAFVGTVIFIIIGTPAVGLSLLVHQLAAYHVPTFTITVLTFLEEALLLIDAIAVMMYVIVSTYRELRDLIQEGNEK